MSSTTPSPDEERNPGQRHADQTLGFSRFNPSDRDKGVGGRLSDLEQGADKPGEGSKRDIGDQEAQPINIRDLAGGRDLRDIARERRKSGVRRGLLIGGTAGGFIAIFFGFLTLLPFKLPALNDFIHNNSSSRLERMVVKRGEQILFMFLLRGSAAAIANNNLIITGNPIGDLFANLRTLRFEETLRDKYGLSIDRGTQPKSIKISFRGEVVEDNIESVARIQQLLGVDSGEYRTRDARKVIKQVVNKEVPWYRWLKRIHLKTWMKTQFHVRRLDRDGRKPGQTDAERVNDLVTEHAGNIGDAQVRALDDYFNKLEGKDDLSEEEKLDLERFSAGGANKIAEQLGNDMKESVKEAAAEASDALGLTDSMQKIGVRVGTKMGTKAATILAGGGATGGILYIVGFAVLLAELDERLSQQTAEDNIFMDFARLKADMYGAYSLVWSGLSENIKAVTLGTADGLDAFDIGVYSDMMNGAEESAAYNIMNSGENIGEGLRPIDKINTRAAPVEWLDTFNYYYTHPLTVVLRSPLIAIRYTLGWLLDQGGDLAARGMEWAIENVPCVPILTFICPKTAVAAIFGKAAELFALLQPLIGLNVDPLDANAKGFNNWAAGNNWGYNEFVREEADGYDLSITQAADINRRVAAYRAEVNASMPLNERLLALDNPHSLASTLLVRTPMPSMNGGLGNMAFAGLRFLGNTGLALFSNRAFAADGDAILEDLDNTVPQGVIDADLNKELAPEVMNGQDCPENDPNDGVWNPCGIDTMLVSSFECSISPTTCDPLQPSRPSGGTSTATSQQAAAQILSLIGSKISLWSRYSNVLRNELETIREGQLVQSVCASKGKINLDAGMLSALVETAKTYSFQINTMNSGHDCDGGTHPLGRGVDLDMVNGVPAEGNLGTPLYSDFITELYKHMPPGSRLGQVECTAVSPPGVERFPDACNHLHVDVGFP